MHGHTMHPHESRNDSSERDRTTSMMCIALAAGLFVGAQIAWSSYRSARRQRARVEHRDDVRRWEGEGGAIGSAVSTPPAQ